MKTKAEGNPLAQGRWADESYYSVSAVLRRRGRIVFWISLFMMLLLFLSLVPARGQAEGTQFLLIEKAGRAATLIATGTKIKILKAEAFRDVPLEGPLNSVSPTGITMGPLSDGSILNVPLTEINRISARGYRAPTAGLVSVVTIPIGGLFIYSGAVMAADDYYSSPGGALISIGFGVLCIAAGTAIHGPVRFDRAKGWEYKMVTVTDGNSQIQVPAITDIERR